MPKTDEGARGGYKTKVSGSGRNSLRIMADIREKMKSSLTEKAIQEGINNQFGFEDYSGRKTTRVANK
jgi:hypothetical protein